MKRKKIKSSWTAYFNFSARERRGALTLSFILILLIALNFYLRSIHSEIPSPNPEIIARLREQIKNSDSIPFTSESKIVLADKKISYFNFDPNLINDSGWSQLGFTEKQIRTFRNYLNGGGKFRTQNDFKKMYCVSENKFDELKPYLLLPESIPIKVFEKKIFIHEPLQVNIDQVDSMALMKLKGIGPVLASRIIRYRESLGGFYSTEQLKEVWGISDSLFQSLVPFISVQNPLPFRFLNLNTDSFAVFSSHPYIRGKIASLICNYRKQHKSFTSLEELKQLPLLTEENFLKLAPYLTLN